MGDIDELDKNAIKEKSNYLLKLQRKFEFSFGFTSGFYALHLYRWLMFFHQSNLMIINGEDLFKDPGPIIEKVQDFLEVPRLLLRGDFVKDPKTGIYCIKNIGKNNALQCLPSAKYNEKDLLHFEIKKRLDSIYASYNEAFFKMISKRFNW